MRIKSLYIYVIIFIAFIISLIIFSPSAKESTLDSNVNPHGQMPDDDIHRGMSQKNENMPSKSNVAKEALKKLNHLKEEYDRNPDDTVKIRNYADMLTLAHQHDKAVELYEKILKVDSKRIDILQHLTFLYFNKGELDKAEEMSEKILTIQKGYPLALYNLGVISYMKGDKQKAKYYWNEVLKKEPNSKLAKNARELLQNLDLIKK